MPAELDPPVAILARTDLREATIVTFAVGTNDPGGSWQIYTMIGTDRGNDVYVLPNGDHTTEVAPGIQRALLKAMTNG